MAQPGRTRNTISVAATVDTDTTMKKTSAAVCSDVPRPALRIVEMPAESSA